MKRIVYAFAYGFILVNMLIVGGGLAIGQQSPGGELFPVDETGPVAPTPDPVKPPVIQLPAEDPKGGIADGVIDAARDRAIEKAGLSWAQIQDIVNTIKVANERGKKVLGIDVAQTGDADPLPSDFVIDERPKVVDLPKQISRSYAAYNSAYHASEADRKPLVVFLHTDWCKWCRPLAQRFGGGLMLGNLALVDIDEEPSFKSLMMGDLLPQTVVYYDLTKSDSNKIYVGYQPSLEILSYLSGHSATVRFMARAFGAPKAKFHSREVVEAGNRGYRVRKSFSRAARAVTLPFRAIKSVFGGCASCGG